MYFYHPDHLGSTSYVTDGSGEVYQHLEYFAFGETFVDEHSNTDRIPYLFNGKGLDEDTGLYYFGARYYDPRTSIWSSVDPKAERHPMWSPFVAMADNPIRLSDPDGMEAQKPKPDKPGPSWWRETKFTMAHPLASATIGSVAPGAVNISTDAARFSTRGSSPAAKKSVLDEPKSQGNMGSQVNAMRHVLWQSTITADFGSNIAKEVGFAHEENPNAIANKTNAQLASTKFKTLDAADESIDLANNVTGRAIGEANKGKGMKEIALKVLDAYHTEGFWTATKQKDGTWMMTNTKISDDQYKALKAVYETLNNDGFTPAEQQKRDEEERKANGHVIK